MSEIKKILALTISFLMIITNIPIFANDAVTTLGDNTLPGTLVDSHGFLESDIPGRKIINNYSDTTNFSGKYTDDGFVLNRETKMESGTGTFLSDELMRINLTKRVEEEYQYGLEGRYAIDITVNGHFSSGMSARDVYLDGYMVCTDDVESLPTVGSNNVKMRFIAEQNKTGNTHFQVLSASDSNLKTDLAPIPVDTDTVIRLIIDSETGDVELYTSADNKQTFVSYGSLDGVFKGDKIQSFVFNPGLGLIKATGKTSTMTFKKIDIYEINIYEVKFFVDGAEYETVEVNAGSTVSSLSAPEKENYVFEGWYLEGANTAFDFTAQIEEDIKLYAKYKGVASNIVFKADGDIIETLTGEFGGTVEGVIPDVPEKDGYTVVGWYIGDTPFTDSTIITSTEMEVVAKYADANLNRYTVTFIVDGHEYSSEDVIEGYVLQNVPAEPFKANYVFDGWMNGNEIFDIKTPVTSDITLIAKFEPKDIVIKYYIDDTLKELYDTKTGKYGLAIGTLPTPEKSSYKFLGWKKADGTELTKDQILTEDINVYATWESLIKVVLDEDITSNDGLTDNIVEYAQTGVGTATNVIYDKGVVLKWVKEMPTSRDANNELVVKFKVPLNDEDSENRTRIYNNKLIGDYEVEVKMDVKLSGVWNNLVTSTPFGYYSTGYVAGSGFSSILENRIQADGIKTFNSLSAATSNFNSSNTYGRETTYAHSKTSERKLPDGTFVNVINRLRFDSTKNYAEMIAPGYTEKSYGDAMGSVPGINGFRFKMMGCFQPGDFIRVKNIKVTQYNFDDTNEKYIEAMNIISQLPESIVAEGDSPYNVTQNLNILSQRGVTWISSDKKIADASTGEITKWYESQDVVITALVNVGDYSYSKEYKLTIQGDTSIVKETVLEETFTSEADMTNWSFENISDSPVADYVIGANGIKISKVVAPEVSNSRFDEKIYLAYYDLYKETKADTYTSTATKDLNGVYDVSINIGEYVATSKVPMNIIIGYRTLEQIYEYCSLVFDSSGIKFRYVYDPETMKELELGDIGTDSVIKFRIDNILGEVALYVNGELRERLKYYTPFGEDAMINSVITCIDKNNEAGDGVTIKGIKVEKIVANLIAKHNDLINAADSLTVDEIVDNFDAVSSVTLPSTIGGYKVDWKSSSDQIDVETLKVYYDKDAKAATLIAEIYDANAQYPVFARKTFNVTVRAAENDNELGEFQISKLGKITNQNYSDIRYDLSLPQADNVIWSSSNTDIIGNDGKINDTVVLTENTPVTITASSNGSTANFDLIVAPRTEQVKLAEGTLPLNIKLGNVDNAKISSDVTTKFTYTYSSANTGKVNVINDNGDVLVSMASNETGIYFDYKNSDYNEIVLNDGQSVNVEILVMPDVDRVAVFVDDKIVVDYATLKVNTDYVAGVTTNNPSLLTSKVEMTVDRYGLLYANMDNIDYFKDIKFGYANQEGIELPKDTVSSCDVSWKSSNTNLINDEGTVIEVPESMTYVNIEFKITDKSFSDIFVKKNFNVAVDCDNKNNIVWGIVPEFTNLVDLANPEINVSDNNIKTVVNVTDTNKKDSEMIFNLGGEKTFNSMFIAQLESGIEEYVIYKSNDGLTWTEIAKGTFDDEPTEFVKFNTTVASHIKFKAKQCTSKYIKINEIKVFLKATKDELAQIDLDLLTISAIAEGTKIELPVVGINGTVITWSSSDSKVISTNGDITRPSSATTVKLTATVMVSGGAVTREFEVYVDSKSTNGPTQVGGDSGGGAGGGVSGGAASRPVIGTTTDDTVYFEPGKEDEGKNIVSSKYSDVKVTDWYYGSVMKLTEKGIVSGDGTGNFNPDDDVTREQFVKMILVALDIEIVEEGNEFSDVDETAWYYDYVTTAHKLGIVNGLAETHFGIGSNITRQDMAVLIERVLNSKNVEVEKEEVIPFEDGSTVADYAKDAVANMKAIGLVKGYDNYYNPKNNLTRAEAATVITTLLELLAK